MARDRLWGAEVAFLIALTFTAAHVVVLGAPAFLLGVRLRAVRWWSVLAAAFVMGFVSSAWAAGTSNLVSALWMGAGPRRRLGPLARLALLGAARRWVVGSISGTAR